MPFAPPRGSVRSTAEVFLCPVLVNPPTHCSPRPRRPRPLPSARDEQPEVAVHVLIIACGVIGILFAVFNAFLVNQVKLPKKKAAGSTELTQSLTEGDGESWQTQINFIYEAVTAGAQTFLFEEYKVRLCSTSLSLSLARLTGLLDLRSERSAEGRSPRVSRSVPRRLASPRRVGPSHAYRAPARPRTARHVADHGRIHRPLRRARLRSCRIV